MTDSLRRTCGLPLLLAALLAACRDAPPSDTPGPRATLPPEEAIAPADTPITDAEPFVLEECDAVTERVRLLFRHPVRRLDGTYRGYWRDAEEHGCQLRGTGRFSVLADPGGPVAVLYEDLVGQGWSAELDYAADGPDGSVVGVSRNGVVCLIIGTWQGGEEAVIADSAAAPPPADPDTYELRIECTSLE